MKDIMAKIGGRNFTLAGSSIAVVATMNGLDPVTKAWVIGSIAIGHCISRGLADGLSKGSTASK